MSHRNFIIVSSIDWTTHWQMPQQLATALIGAGNRVLFIDNTGVRAPRLGDGDRIRERMRNWLKSTKGFSEIQSGLTVFSPLFLPFPYSRVAGWINRFLLSRSVNKWMRITRFHDPVVFTFLPTPLSQALIRDVDPVLVVYYCANDMAGSSPAVRKLRLWEDILFAQADLVFVISEAIHERASLIAKHIYFFPPGVDFEKFENARRSAPVPGDIANLKHPIVGYVGALSDVLDQDLLITMAAKMPSVTYVLVGPKYTDVSRLEAVPNIRLLGARPHADIPAYIKGFDVALIPYVLTPFTDSVYSCKLNEYLSIGVPVVSTNLREIRNFIAKHGEVISIGRDADDFDRIVCDALFSAKNSNSEMKTLERIAVAKLNSWDQRFAEIGRVVERHLAERLLAGRSWQERLLGYYRQNRIVLLTRLAMGILFYAVIFHSPLAWYAGDQLVGKGKPVPADAIVVFGGHGDATYVNTGYQRRTEEAISLYKEKWAPLLVVSSSVQQNIAEADIMKALIIAQGIPSDAVVLDRHAKNTIANVEAVNRILNERNCKSILLVTAPYHARRALMTWNKNAPDKSVVAVSNIDSPPSTPRWDANFGQIQVIAYEYLAIAYNWMRGWV